MRLGAMADLHAQHMQNAHHSECTPDEYLSLLTDHEWEHRYNRKLKRLITQAGFRQKATLAEIDYNAARGLEKNMFMRLASLEFIKRNENIIVTGPSGVGKSFLAHALGHQACMMQLKTGYRPASRLMADLRLAKADGTYLKELKKLANTPLLIIDDFGLQSFDNSAREMLMDIIDDRFTRASTIIATQLPVSTWYEVIGEGTIADAILDRIVNSSHRIELKGESLRKGMLKQT